MERLRSHLRLNWEVLNDMMTESDAIPWKRVRGIESRIDSSNRNEIGIGNQLEKGIEVTEIFLT
jgi:hypothetical protein